MLRIATLLFTLLLLMTVPAAALSAPEDEPAKAAKKSAKQTVTSKAKKVSPTPAKKGVKSSAQRKEPAVAKRSVDQKARKGVPAKKKAAAAPAAFQESVTPLAVVKEVRSWATPDYTRIVVTLDREVPYEQHELALQPGAPAQPRIYLDISSARLGPAVRDIPIGDGLLKAARAGQYSSDVVRVVLDLDSIKEYKVFTFSDPFRVIVDVKGERKTEISRAATSVAAVAAALAEEQNAPAKESLPQEPAAKAVFKPGKVRRIVVDPGHGGKDPGAIGPTGTQEKDIVLEIGLKLAKKLKEELGLDVVMTRSTDVFIELQERTAIANQVGADLFVSVHANASLNRATSGIETFYLNLAKTEKVAQLAALENGTTLEKVSLLQAVLFDLMANYKLNDSAHLADEVQKALYRRVSSRYPAVKNHGVKQGPFYVLVGATMPSVLVESAFLSNEQEEERLNDSKYQELTAEGIMEGIKGYIVSLK